MLRTAHVAPEMLILESDDLLVLTCNCSAKFWFKMNLATMCCCRSVARQGQGRMLLVSFAGHSLPDQTASEAGTQEIEVR